MEQHLKTFISGLLIVFIYYSVFMFVQFLLSYVVGVFFLKQILSIALTILILKPFDLGGE